ncbi:hypothetical protein TVAG_373640 [Trichomonas vaginalis G3]|uniref:PAS domain-containing protein n=1 Tax=Trichomonas vaginalis (strain ATCC PRA-98 / G3) TaxID=412133 RepID=A2FQQ5_TRIV3|nr:guanylate cyclase protein [Trichomonas vaginalis G3]EAX92764.1 hypothetical protein TVAG_373640 [Trichomonas vaginalis G3]KAI5498742.1 guanylate cyclase protein [Trichomonas vaginalis G3]|eukprot:XP_001305694.1 hypothetical protein [Trichomonas vaginalis G3]
MDLPKTVVSSVSQSFNSLKDGEKENKNSSNGDNELTRQEESIIKLFSSISDNVASNSQMINMIFFIIIVALSLVCFYMIYTYYKVASNKVFYDCNHINYLYGSITFLYSICARLWKVVLDKAHPSFTGTIVNITDEVINIRNIITYQSTYFNSFNLGTSDVNEVPFSGNNQAIKEANELLKCDDYITPPQTIPDSLHCLSATHQLYYTTAKLKKITLNMMSDPSIWPRTRGDGINDIWQVGPVEMYEAYFYPTGVKLIPSMIKNIDNQGYNIINISCIFAVLILIFMISILISTRIEEVFIKFALSQLLRCPASTILNNKKIVDLLSGVYSDEDTEHAEKHVNFSNQVVNKLDDVVIVTQDETGIILSVNNSFFNMFSMNESHIEHKLNIRDFFIERFGEAESNKIYTQTATVIYTKKDGSKVYLEFSSNLVSGNRIYFARDQTQNVLHEKLIEDEKKKSDAMLASILPPMLVSRVQSGEKNISFSVQSVTVLFLDVVEFTPWCGSQMHNMS